MYVRTINLIAEYRINWIRCIIISCHGVSVWPLILLIKPLPIATEASLSLLHEFKALLPTPPPRDIPYFTKL